MHEVGFVLEQFVNALDDVPFPQHDLVPHRYQFVLHFNPNRSLGFLSVVWQ